MSIIGFLKRVRTALLKRYRAGRDEGNIVFKYVGHTTLELVNAIQIDGGSEEIFRDWSHRDRLEKQVADETAGGAKCYIVSDDSGGALCYLLTKQAHQLDQWYVELKPDDVVIFSVETALAARGQRLAGRLAASVAQQEQAQQPDTYLDCAVWNLSAHRAFETAGFQYIDSEPRKLGRHLSVD